MFVALHRMFKSFELGLQLSMAAHLYEGKPDLFRAYVLSQLGTGAPAARPAIVADERELSLAA